MSKRNIAIILGAAWLLPFGVQAEATPGQPAEYKAAYEEALAAHVKVVSRNNQWTTTLDVLEAARQAAEQKEYGKATVLAEKAEQLAELALQQARHQEKVWKRLVPK